MPNECRSIPILTVEEFYREETPDAYDDPTIVNLVPNNAWSDHLPVNVLLKSLSYLPLADLGRVQGVCQRWCRIGNDHTLWRRLFRQRYNLPGNIKLRPEAAGNYRNELERLIYTTPTVEAAVIREHMHQVLYVAYSPCGRYFATASKDRTIKVFSTTPPYNLEFELKQLDSYFKFRYTQFVQFNRNGTLLLVSATLNNNSYAGEVHIYKLIDGVDKRLSFRCRTQNTPYDIFGCWFDDDHFLTGEIFRVNNNLELCLCRLWISKADQDIGSATSGVYFPLYKFIQRNGANIRMILCSDVVSDEVRQAILIANATMQHRLLSDQQKDGRANTLPMSQWMTVLFPFASQEKLDDNTFPPHQFCVVCESAHQDTTAPCYCICHKHSSDRILCFSTGAYTYTPHQIGFKIISGRYALSKFSQEIMPQERRELIMQNVRHHFEHQQQHVQQDQGHDDDGNINEDDDDIPEADELLRQATDQIDYTIEMSGQVVGITLTSDQRYLLVNVRPWVNAPLNLRDIDPFEAPRISNNIELHLIDLTTLSVVTKRPGQLPYTGHSGVTSNEHSFIIFANGVDDLLTSGSETGEGILWSRYYNVQLAKFMHGDTVNCAAINPHNYEQAVTVSDDNKIKIWESRRATNKLCANFGENSIIC